MLLSMPIHSGVEKFFSLLSLCQEEKKENTLLEYKSKFSTIKLGRASRKKAMSDWKKTASINRGNIQMKISVSRSKFAWKGRSARRSLKIYLIRNENCLLKHRKNLCTINACAKLKHLFDKGWRAYVCIRAMWYADSSKPHLRFVSKFACSTSFLPASVQA